MSWKAEYVILILISTIANYSCGLGIHKTNNDKIRKIYLLLSIIVSLGILIFFKYFNFLSESLRDLLSIFTINMHPLTVKLLLPVGISFYTFQSLCYTIDVYRGKIKPEKHFGIFAVYVSYFPQLVAGPIERARNLIPRLREKVFFDYERVTQGFRLMLWGFFKKIVVADRLSIVVDQIYSSPNEYSSIPLILATIFFAFQIYCDFSGYSDIAIGTSKVMGIKLMQNFKRPYFSKSISEFWKRWHISLSTWFRDYVYIPLGGSRVPRLRFYYNLLVVFLISGLWHGANWTFVIWGGVHGLYLVASSMTRKWRYFITSKLHLMQLPRFHSMLQVGMTFFLVNIGWIFFRANTIKDAADIFRNILFDINLNLSNVYIGLSWTELVFALVSIVIVVSVNILQEKTSVEKIFCRSPGFVKLTLYLAIIFAIIIFGEFGNKEFIYFQF